MIFQNRNKKPFINFGFNSQSITANVGDQIIIWQSEIFNTDIYNPLVISDDATSVLVGVNKSIISFAISGTYTVSMRLALKKNAKANEISNIVTVNIV